MRTLELKNFGEGEDLSDGEFSSDQNRFLELINYRITNRRRIQRRPPCVKVAGAFGVNTLSMTLRNGELLTLVPRGVGSGIGTPTGVTTLAFDVPAGAISTAIEDMEKMGDTVVALLRHAHTDGTWFFSLHVFDDKPNLFTYTTDPAFPWWHIRAASSEELPRAALAVAASKVWVNGPDGDTHSSGVADARKWNQLTLPELLAYGYQFHYYHSGVTTANITLTIPVNYADFAQWTPPLLGSPVSHFRVQEAVKNGAMDHADAMREDKWGDQSGVVGNRYVEVIGAGNVNVDGEWSPGLVANGAVVTTYTNWLRVVIRMRPGRWYRFTWTPPNIIASPFHSYVQSGIYKPDNTSGGLIDPYQFLVGDGARSDWELDAQFLFTVDPLQWVVKKNGTTLTYTTDFTIEVTTGKRCKILFITTPANGDGLDINQLLVVYTGGQCAVIVPPGQFNVRGVTYDFPGQICFLADGSGPPLVFTTVGVDVDALVGASAAPVITYNNVGNQYIAPRWNFIPLLFVQTDSPVNPAFSAIFSERYTPNAAQESAFQDAQDYAGSSANERDTTSLPTASHDSSGGIPTLLHGVKNRLLVCYGGSKQLWAVNEDANADEKLTVEEGGTGDQATPHGVRYSGGVMVPLVDGYNLLSLVGDQSDKFNEDAFVGDKIERFGVPNVLTAVFWPKLREYVAAEIVDGEFRLRVLDLHRTKAGTVSGWSRWPLTGVSAIDYRTMIAIGDRLYFRSGTSLYYIDAGAYDRTLVAGTFRDTNDTAGAGNAYRSRAVWRFNDFKKPGVKKDLRGMQVVQTPCGLFTKVQLSTAEFRFRPVGFNTDLEELGPTITGSTYGKDPCDLSMETDHLSVVMESTDELGHELQALAILFDYQEES